MSIEDLQSAWKSHDPGKKMSVSSEVLLGLVQRNHREFETTLFWRDAREVITCVGLAAFFLYRAIAHGLASDYLTTVACVGVGTYMLIDRWLQRKHRPQPGTSLQAGIKANLAQIDHQIWLLKNVGWWYLLPLAIGIVVSIMEDFPSWRDGGIESFLGLAIYVLIFAGVYWLNQVAVNSDLIPRQRELESLLANLEKQEPNT